MKQLITRIRILGAFNQLVRNPTKTDMVFKLSDLGRNEPSKMRDEAISHISNLPGMAQRLRQQPPSFDLARLEKYPENSLGRVYAEHMRANNLDPNFFPWEKDASTEALIVNHARSVHDLWHVLTGFDTSVPGELGLQAFTAAQMKSPFNALLIAAGILHVLTHAQDSFFKTIDAMTRGFRLGAQAENLLALPIENYLEENLSSLRERLRLTA